MFRFAAWRTSPRRGTRVSSSTVSELNQKIYHRIEQWRNRPIEGDHPYVCLDGIWLKRSWGGEVKNVAVLVAVGVGSDGHRTIPGVCEGTKEDAESWRGFLRHVEERGLRGLRLIVSDKCLGLVEALEEFFPKASWQCCTVHFYRNVLKEVPRGKSRDVAAMLKAVHAQGSAITPEPSSPNVPAARPVNAYRVRARRVLSVHDEAIFIGLDPCQVAVIVVDYD